MNTRTVNINMAGVELATDAKPVDLIAFADVLLRAVQRALDQETTEPVQLEDHERFALSVLIDGARDAMAGAVQR